MASVTARKRRNVDTTTIDEPVSLIDMRDPPPGIASLRVPTMCKNIKTLFNFEPPATEEEIQAAALQFVRKVSGFNKPSRANEESFDRAVEEVGGIARALLGSLTPIAPPR